MTSRVIRSTSGMVRPPRSAATTPAVERSGVDDPEPGPCCLEFLFSRVRDLILAEEKELQALELLQFLQPRIRDCGAAEAQRVQALEFLQLLQPRVRDQGAAEVQRLQALEFL